MKRLKLVSEGVLYRNPHPGYKAECAYLPNLLKLCETEFLCIIRIGSAFYSADGKLTVLRSKDQGNTWERENYVWNPQDDQKSYSYTAPHATRLSDGTIILIGRRWDSTDPELPVFNPRTGGVREGDVILFRSTDDGRTWTSPEVLEIPGEGLADTPSQIIELNDGRWFLACELWKRWNDERPLHIKGFAVFSSDRGKSWKDRLDFPSAADPERMYSHSRYTKMLDGRIAALQWTQEVGTAKDLNQHLAISDETGTKWSAPVPTNLLAQTSWLADLGDGLLAATYTQRGGMRPGICTVLSSDGGYTWDLEHQILVWDAVGQEFLGVTHQPKYPASHDNIAFGKPHTARLSDGEIISSWWCTQACVTHSRFARLALE